MRQRRALTVAAVALVVAGIATTAVVAASCGRADSPPAAASSAGTPGAAAGASGQATGVSGTITLVNPGGPMITPGESPSPASAVVLELLSPATKQVIARGPVARDGSFKIGAPPGRYLVRIAPVSGGPSATVSHVIVVAPGGYAHVTLGPVRGL